MHQPKTVVNIYCAERILATAYSQRQAASGKKSARNHVIDGWRVDGG
jgi:hypothetical protein